MNKDELELLRKVFTSTTKEVNEAERTIRVVISTKNPDRSKDVVFPEGMDIEKFLTNPVVAEFHQYSVPAIANATTIEKFSDRVEAVVKFFEPGTYDRSDLFWKLYSTRKMQAWSIGFIPKQYTINEFGGYDFTETELLEFSAVLVPDNAEALTYAKSIGANVDEMLAKQKEVTDATAEVEANLPEPEAKPEETTAEVEETAGGEAPVEPEKPADEPTPEPDESKSAQIVVAKDVDEVVSLANVADYLQFLIRMFGSHEVDEKVIAKLIEALKAIMAAIKDEAEFGKKSFTITVAEKTADIEAQYLPAVEPEKKDEAKQLIVAMAKELKPAVSSINKFLHSMREFNNSAK